MRLLQPDDDRLVGLNEGMDCESRTLGSEDDVLPKRVILFRRLRGWHVCRSSIRQIHRGSLATSFHLEAVLQRGTAILVFQHFGLFDFGQIEVPLVPALLKFANSSFGARNGCVSPSPLISCYLVRGSQRTRFSAYSHDRSAGRCRPKIGNIWPLLKLPLCAMVGTEYKSAPVFSFRRRHPFPGSRADQATSGW